MRLLHQWFRTNQPRRPVSCRPTMEVLEDREVPTLTSISSTFNGTAIPAGSSVWFNSVGKVSGLGNSPATIRLTQATITSGQFTVAVPDATIIISPSVTTASTTFDAVTNTWTTVVPRSYSGNVFLAGATLPAPNGLPGGIKPVVWQADFTTDTPGVNINWKWAAAVYTTFSSDYNAVGAKPIDGSAANPYANSDHAGTPENFKAFVFGGARGGGGSNFTGSYSATKSVTPGPFEPALSSLSGFVFQDNHQDGSNEATIAGVEIILEGTDDLGPVFLVTYTDVDGHYIFENLRPGTYSIRETQPANYTDGLDYIGTQGGSVDSDLNADRLYNIFLGAGVNGENNNFSEVFAGS